MSAAVRDGWRGWYGANRRTAVIYGSAALVAGAAGAVSATSRLVLLGLFVGLLVSAAVALSRRALFWFVVLGGLVITGLAQLYLSELKYFKYLLPMAAGALFLHGFMDRLRDPAVRRADVHSPIVFWLYAFMLVAAISTLVNWNPELAARGVRNYFLVWIFFFAVILSCKQLQDLDSLPKALLLIAFLQLPFVAHQFLVLVPLRRTFNDPSIVPVDVVVGTFGANLTGGGANAVLSLFIFIVIACLLGLWKYGALSRTKTVLLAVPLIVPVFLNETKVSAVYLPTVFLVLFFRDIIRKPLRFLVMVAVGFGLFALMLNAIITMHSGSDVRSWSDLVNLIYSQQTRTVLESDDEGDYSSLTRWTALTYWAQENRYANPVYIAIGHGLGASWVRDDPDDQSPSISLAEKKYGGIRLGYTALSAMLWDTGLLGVLTVLCALFAAYRAAGRLAARYKPTDPFRAGIFDGLRASMCLIALSMAHKDFFVYSAPYQILVLLVLAYIVVAQQGAQRA